MKVLYVNHTAAISGGERSLLELLAALPEDLQARVAAPAGPLRDAVLDLSVPVTPITGTAGSLRLHPLHTPRALAEMARAAVQVRSAASRMGADIVHANSIRSGIVTALAPMGGVASVVHVRDCLPAGAVSSATLRLIAARATTVVANSRYTAASVTAAAPRAQVEVVHNGVDLARFDPARIGREAARLRLSSIDGFQADRLLLGVVAQLSPWKGQDTAIEALSLLRRQGIDAHLLLIGSAKFVAASTRYDNEAYLRRLHELADCAGLGDRVSFLGEREDVPELIRALDLLLLPSWEEPFGRAVIEAMALEVPVLATNVGGPAEIVEDGVQGLLLAPRRPEAWAEAAGALAADPERRVQMGRAGRRLAEQRFGLEHLVRAMGDVYERALQKLAKRGRTP
ncbi:MAG: glycosyltransferase family 4 protein [Solirubrobacteraceae bacterium]